MAKQIIFGEAARKSLQSGVDQLANTAINMGRHFINQIFR